MAKLVEKKRLLLNSKNSDLFIFKKKNPRLLNLVPRNSQN
jgi:hypothetical protein